LTYEWFAAEIGVVPSLLTEPPRPAVIRESHRAHWYVVGTVCIGAFMGQLDASIVTIAMPRIGQDLHATVGAVEWVALAYLLVLIASIATVGHLADAFGRKLLYTYGFAVFTGGSALCAVAPSLPVLVGARVVQAIGAALFQANSVALITEAVPRSHLRRAIGIQGTAQALGLALGPAAGGTLVALGGWRLIFLINLPVGLTGLVLAWTLLPRSRSRSDIGSGDAPGAVLLAVAAGGVLAYLSLANRSGYCDPWLLAALAAGVVAAAAFVVRERRAPFPLIELRMLRLRPLAVGLPSGLLSFALLFGALFVLPYDLLAHHVPATRAGLELALLPLGIGITAVFAARLRRGTLVARGMLLTGAGQLLIAFGPGTASLLGGLLVAGIGLGAFIPSNNASIMRAAPRGHTGLVGGLVNMARGSGTAVGVAAAGALYVAGGLSLAMAVLGLAGLVAAACLKLGDADPARPAAARR
jgi:EmrB/QacA subfamily drug resistance transporter